MRYTIIIPAYNSAEFINIPLDSLEKQTYADQFQVLIVNDGSSDNLKKVVTPYLKRNKSWELINKRNGNWGSVINYVKHKNLAKGEYVTVLDSDDYFEPTMLRHFSRNTKDIIITNIFMQKGEKKKIAKVMFGPSRKMENSQAFTPLSMPHGKFYKKELFDKMIDLREGVPYQDTVMFNDLMSKAKNIRFSKRPLATWWYDRPGNSTMEVWDLKRATLWLETCQRITTLPYVNDEANAWALMYLWELNRKYKGEIPFKVSIDTTKAKFLWLPRGTRTITKLYMKMKTSKYRK